MSLFNLTNAQVGKIVSKTVYETLVQDLFHLSGKGLSDKFIPASDADAGAVDIYVPKPLNNRLRQYGGETNGDWENTGNDEQSLKGKHIKSKRFSVDMTKRYDQNIPITEDEVELTNSTNLTKGLVTIAEDQVEKDIAVQLNGATLAEQVYKWLKDSFADWTEPTEEEIAGAMKIYTATTDRYAAADAFRYANDAISDGDSNLNAGFFPSDERQGFIRGQFLTDLQKSFTQNASDVVAEINATGFLNPFTQSESKRINLKTGIVGLYDGVPLTRVSGQVFSAMCYYLGVEETDKTARDILAGIVGLICPANATIRGMKPNSFKVIDYQHEQGVVIQPKVKYGIRCLSGKALHGIVTGASWADATKAAASVTTLAGKLKLMLVNRANDSDNYYQG